MVLKYGNIVLFRIINPIIPFNFWNLVHLSLWITEVLYQLRTDVWANHNDIVAKQRHLHAIKVYFILIELIRFTIKFIIQWLWLIVIAPVSRPIFHVLIVQVSNRLYVYALPPDNIEIGSELLRLVGSVSCCTYLILVEWTAFF